PAAARNDERIRIWLHKHLEEPRFDNPMGKMPSFAELPETTREDIIAYVLTLH
ncbi:hypothetical protein HY256_01630, partial [Candidatus Sumerlaeota bacterium]|nr:hypothetical protein [Candidatus Sumerlaeota bacterium]